MHAYRDQYAQLFRNGRDIVLVAISTDTAEDLASWARDDEFPFLFGSDAGAAVGKRYGAFVDRASGPLDNRTLFVVDGEGRVAYVAAPFREIDPTAYEELGEALKRIAPPADEPAN
ncbi:MAG: redoxin domain-containing protein [Gemmatimonadota bacterium]|nr:MAG: redoxin domain-containing protein [Gemmatimonadota bacterium]